MPDELPMLQFFKEFEGMRYGNETIGARPVRALSLESAERMILEMKATIVVKKKPAQSEENE